MVLFLGFFFGTCNVLKTWFELSSVELYRNYLKGSKNEFELSGVNCICQG